MIYGINECFVQCKKVIDLLEQDALEFNKTAEDEMLDAYRSIVKSEIREMKQILNALQKINL